MVLFENATQSGKLFAKNLQPCLSKAIFIYNNKGMIDVM